MSNKLYLVPRGQLEYRDFEEMYEIDKLVLRSDLIAEPQISFEWYLLNKYTHIAVKDEETETVVGYITALPIFEDLYDEILLGNFKDNELTTDQIREYNFPDLYKLYISSVCIHPHYQNTDVLLIMYKELMRIIIELAWGLEIYIMDVVAEASTEKGKKFCETVGMKKVVDTEHKTEIYEGKIFPLSMRVSAKYKCALEMINEEVQKMLSI